MEKYIAQLNRFTSIKLLCVSISSRRRKKVFGRLAEEFARSQTAPFKLIQMLEKLGKSVFNKTMKSSTTAGQEFSFKAKLENWAEGMDYCAVPVPAKITQALGTNSAVLVLARVNGSEPFKVSLFPVGGGQHYIRIKAKVRKETKTKTGDRIRLQFTVLDRADVTYPPDLLRALRAEKATQNFKSLPPGEQNFILRRLEEAAKPETRQKRIQEAIAAARRRKEKQAGRSK